jgi:uncharacterized protein (TIGR02246 family)
MFVRVTSAALLAVASLTACQQAETAEQIHARLQMESDSARVALEARAAAFVAAFNAQNAEAAAAFYAPDAVLMPPDMPAVVGRDAIRAGMEAMMGQMPPGSVFALHLTSVSANGPIAVDRGEWSTTLPGPDGASMEIRGKYLAEWHKINGEWLMVSDIWNNDAPMPPM